MNKYLVNSEKEYMELFKDFDLQDVEKRFLNIEFAFEDGTYLSDMQRGLIPWNDDQELDISTYRKFEDSYFPEEYPCIVLLENEEDYFIWGPKIKTEILAFVYLKDFGEVKCKPKKFLI